MLEGMYKGKDQGGILTFGDIYFLFPNGSLSYYVSRFPNPKAHFGCFDKSLFDVLDNLGNSEPEKKKIILDQNKVYSAKLIWRREGYSNIPLKQYFITPNLTHCYFYSDRQQTHCLGSFPIHWFEDFREVTPDKTTNNIIEETRNVDSLDLFTWEQLSLFD